MHGPATEPALKEMADARPALVEGLRVETMQRVHPAPEVRLGRLDQHVHMVRHQAVRKAVPSELLHDTVKQLQIPLAILVVEKDQAPFNPAGEYVPDPRRNFVSR